MHGSLSLSPDGSFIYTPTTGFVGTDSFTFAPFDGSLHGANTTAVITVQADPTLAANSPPVATNDSYSVLHDTTLTVPSWQGPLANDTDPNGRFLTASLLTNPVDGTLQFNIGGSFQYIPKAGFVGTDSFTYQVSNGFATSSAATVTLNVTDAAPTVSPVSYTTVHGQTLIIPSSRGVLASATDADADSLTAALVSQPAHGSISLAVDGSFIYTPQASFLGTDSFTFSVSDGARTTAPVTATIQVTDTAPVATAASYQLPHDSTLNVASSIGVLASATDADGDSLTAMLVTQATHGTVALQANGSFTYVPNAGYIGTDSFSFKASDGFLASTPVVVSLTITNPAPTAENAAYLYSPGSTLSISQAGGLQAYGYDPEEYTLTPQLVHGASHGTLTLNSNGSFTYDPQSGFTGNDSFTYEVTNGWGTSTVATVALEALPGPTSTLTVAAPVAYNVTYQLDHDTHLSTLTSGSGLLASAIEPEGFPLTATLVSNVSHGTLSLLPDGAFVYQPTAGFTGVDQFTYSVSNGLATSNVAIVSLDVTDTAPNAGLPITYTNTANNTLSVLASTGLLRGATDADHDALTAQVVTGSAPGSSLSVAPDGSFSYTPPAGFVGTDSFTFDVNDGVLNSLPQTVSIVVTDTPPSVPSLTYSILHDTMLIVSSAPTGPAGSIPGLPGQPGGGEQGVLASAINPSGNP